MPALPPSVIYVLSWLLSGLSLGYELTLAKTMADLSGFPAFWESISVGIYILGLGIGFLVHFERSKGSGESWPLLLQVELCLCLLGAGLVPSLLLAYGFYRSKLFDFSMNFLGPLEILLCSLQSVTLLIGILSGLEQRLLLTQAVTRKRENHQNLVLASAHFGALTLALLYGYVFLSRLSTLQIGALFSVVNGLIAGGLAYLWGRAQARAGGARVPVLFRVFLTTGLLFALVTGWQAGWIEQLHLKNFYYNKIAVTGFGGEIFQTGPVPLSRWVSAAERYPPIVRMRTQVQAIDIVREVVPVQFDQFGQPRFKEEGFSVYLDRHFQFNSREIAYYHEFLAHVGPALNRQAPRKVLVLGGGDGLLVHELLKYPDIHITVVELDAKMLALAKHPPLSQLNQGGLEDSRVTIRVEDAFRFIMQDEHFYDAIYSDFPFPHQTELLSLFSLEFFQAIRARLAAEGFFALDAPFLLDNLAHPWNQKLGSTLFSAGFEQLYAYGSKQEMFLLAFPKLEKREGFTTTLLKGQPVSLWDTLHSPGALLALEREAFRASPLSIFKPGTIGYKDRNF